MIRMTRRYPAVAFICTAVICAGAVCSGTADAGEKPAEDARGGLVLDTRSYFRWHLTYLPEVRRTESGALEEQDPWKVTWKQWRDKNVTMDVFRTPGPDDGWAAPDFDDRGWVRCRGPLIERTLTILGNDAGVPRPCLRLLCLRGRFSVADPAAVKNLKLSLVYRGGVVVRVNGTEVARGHMPEGDIADDTPAIDYPDSAYVTEDGKLMPSGLRTEQYTSFDLNRKILSMALKKAGIAETYMDKCAERVRTLEDASIPANVLRKGINVLAVEIHRAPTSHLLYSAPRQEKGGVDFTWSMINIEALSLTAAPGDGAEGCVSAPEGVRVWVESPMLPLNTLDYGDRFGLPPVIELAGARNGSFNAQIVVGARDGLKSLEVRPSDLARAGGDGSIPASSIRVTYAVPDGRGHSSTPKRYFEKPTRYTDVTRFDTLETDLEGMPAGGATVQPVWLTVGVPRDTAPGRYEGTVAVKANGTDTVVPLGIDIADLALPDPKDFVPYVGLVQSPRSLAIKYDTPMWSDAHWAMIDKSFALLGELGTSVVYVRVIRNTHHGNGPHTMIHWVRGADGTYTHDFSVFERYLDTAVKHLGTDIVVVLYVYDPVRAYGKADECIPLKVSVRDAEGAGLAEMDAPAWDAPEAGDFWKPVFAGAKERMAARGIPGEPAIGTAGQGMPEPAIPVFNKAVPDSRWMIFCHYVRRTVGDKPAHVTGTVMQWPGDLNHVPLARYYGWKDDTSLVVYFPRRFPLQLAEETPYALHHAFFETVLACNFRGIGWCGADFWRVIEDPKRRGRKSNILLPNWNQLSLGSGNVGWTLGPGRKGPVPTIRHEMLRESLQEAECRIFMEKALLDDAKRAALGETLAAECRALLDERAHAISKCVGTHISGSLFAKESEQDTRWYAATAPGRSKRLFEAAGRVARALGM